MKDIAYALVAVAVIAAIGLLLMAAGYESIGSAAIGIGGSGGLLVILSTLRDVHGRKKGREQKAWVDPGGPNGA